jgi:hypothetical protein
VITNFLSGRLLGAGQSKELFMGNIFSTKRGNRVENGFLFLDNGKS